MAERATEHRNADYFRDGIRQDAARAEVDKALYWRRYKLEHGPAAGIRVADELRRQVVRARPGWPDAAERARDHAAHERLLDALANCAPRCG